MKKATINDVAELAGVSLATVSHVINNTRFVSEKLKKKVNNAIKELCYMPDAHAQNFRTGKKKIIGILVPHIVNSVFVTIIDKVEEIVSEEGYNVIVCNTKESKDCEKNYIKLLTSGIVDGIILASTLEDMNELKDALPAGFPVVLVDRTLKNAPCDSVIVTIYDAVYQSVCEVIKNGNRKIGYLVGLPHLSTTLECMNAYKKALLDCDVEFEEDMMQYYNFDYNFKQRNITDCVDNLLAAKCDGILVANSYIALKTVCLLEEWNIRIGKDIQLICLNNYGLLSSNKCKLIEKPIDELGKQTGLEILRRIKDPYAPAKNIVLNGIAIK